MGVVEPFEVWSKTADPAWFRVSKLVRSRSSVSRVAKMRLGYGVDAPIVKYCGSGGAGRALPGTVVGHDSLVDLAGEEPFQASDDVFLGEAFGGAASDVVDGGLVESHAYDGEWVERRVGLSVPAGLS